MDLIFVSLARITVSPQVLDLGEDVFLNSGMQNFHLQDAGSSPTSSGE